MATLIEEDQKVRRKILFIVASLSAALMLCGFTSFTPVRNVCPKCPKTRKADVVVLNTGMRVECSVLAQNNDYYVLQRYGELRAALKSEVKTVEWQNKTPSANLTVGDQILTTNNVVYHGTVTGEQKGRYFEIQVGTLKHLVWYSQVKSVHRGGVPYQFRLAATP